MQTLRKKTSPLKYKNETTRFLGDGVSFKAKLIGILEVSEARGDRMCQEALADLKMAIRAAGEHKQRININIAIDGLRLRDEKTGDSLYHHPVHKISFIAQDMTDSRAFGYIFGSPDTGHRFFGIKTDKAASQVVIAMRDLFQVVFALKKKEIELAKQHLDKTRSYTDSPLFSDGSLSSTKFQSISQEANKSTTTESKTTSGSNIDSKGASGAGSSTATGTAVADLVDLELELNSLQQGLNQMERITPSDPFGSKEDPFGDSFISYPPKPILPPPPSSNRDRSGRLSESFSPRTPHSVSVESADSSRGAKLETSREELPGSGDWLIQESAPVSSEAAKDLKHEMAKKEILSQFDVFTELDPLELKNPPKKVLNDLVSQPKSQQGPAEQQKFFNASFNVPASKQPPSGGGGGAAPVFSTDPFGEDPFVKEDPFAQEDFSKNDDPFETEFSDLRLFGGKETTGKTPPDRPGFKVSMASSTSPRTINFVRQNTFESRYEKFSSLGSENNSIDSPDRAPEPPPRPASAVVQIKPPPLPPKKQPNDLSTKPPPPRPPHSEESHYDFIDNYETAPSSLDYLGGEKSPPLPVPVRKSRFESDFAPERPRKQVSLQSTQSSEEDYLTPISFPFPDKYEYKPVGLGGCKTEPVLLPPPQRNVKKINQAQAQAQSDSLSINSSKSLESGDGLDGLDITLSQITMSGLSELATKLNIPANQLSNMTLVQLTSYISKVLNSKKSEPESSDPQPTFKADFAANFANFAAAGGCGGSESYDRYAVFRELMQEEIKQTKIDSEPEEIKEETGLSDRDKNVNSLDNGTSAVDKYAALREIVEIELRQNDGTTEDTNRNERTEEEPVENIDELNRNIENTLGSKLIIAEEEEKRAVSPKDVLIEYSPSNCNATVKTSPGGSDGDKGAAIEEPDPIPVPPSNRATSGSVSDMASGSSPEIDQTATEPEPERHLEEATTESWAIFEPTPERAPLAGGSPPASPPWSGSSKGGSSPAGQWPPRRGGWWDGHGREHEEERVGYPTACGCARLPRRRRGSGGWGTGGHSSSSRDASPWEEEEPRGRWAGERRAPGGWKSRGRKASWEEDDEEDDYEYEQDHPSGRRRWAHSSSRESERGSDWGPDEWIPPEERRPPPEDWRPTRCRDRWCCPDREHEDHEKHPSRYGSRYSEVKWRQERKYMDERPYYGRESPWEDEYAAPPPRRPNWKRPSSASEMDRSGETKIRHHIGGSDGERDRRYKSGRRSRSKDSHHSSSDRHRPEPVPASRNPHPHHRPTKHHPKGPPDEPLKSATLTRKKPPIAEETATSTFPRKSSPRTRSLFENDFVSSEEVPGPRSTKYSFENDTSEAESPTTVNRSRRGERVGPLILEQRQQQRPVREGSKLSPRSPRFTSKSLFEDDFSPSDQPEDSGISSIKEETDTLEDVCPGGNGGSGGGGGVAQRRTRNRLSNGTRLDIHLRKSESVNIFSRENDPFDDEFFCGDTIEEGRGDDGSGAEVSARSTELKWTEDFEEFDTRNRK